MQWSNITTLTNNCNESAACRFMLNKLCIFTLLSVFEGSGCTTFAVHELGSSGTYFDIASEPVQEFHLSSISCIERKHSTNHSMHCTQCKLFLQGGGEVDLLQHSSKCSTGVNLLALFSTALRRISSSWFFFWSRFSCSRNFGK